MTRSVEPELAENPQVRAFCRALMIAGQDEQLLLRFLRDALTYEEIHQFSKRWAAATLLLEGSSQTQTAQMLKLSTKTVNIVAQFVDGPYATGGYREVFNQYNVSRAEEPTAQIVDASPQLSDAQKQETPKQNLADATPS